MHAWTDRGEQLRQRILILGDQSESSTIRRRCVRPGALSDSFGVPAAAAAAAQQPGSAGATRPKLEVLQALPEAQLFPLMNLVATSLGVRCDYCHVQANPDLPRTPSNLGGWVWDRDDS